jgi:DnaK suppressor protein
MGKKQLQNFKCILAERILTLQDSIDRSIHCLKKGKESLPDPYDLAASEADTSMELAIRERDRSMLLSLYEAIGRIEKGRYGICEQCGELISIKRLMANPATTVCIECKAEAEHLEKKNPGLNPADMINAPQLSGERAGR